MRRILAFLYGLAAYALFLATFLYAIAFVGGFGVPKTIDAGGPAAGFGEALLVNVGLLTLFAVQHSGMARQGFKRWWTRIVPKSIERSTYVLLSSLVLILLFWQWRPMPEVVWRVDGVTGEYVLWTLFGLGWAMVLVATFVINHFDLFGLRQVWLNLTSQRYEHLKFRTNFFYKYIRHPLVLGFIIAFWAIPTMTVGHLLFAVATTGYMLVAIQLEERDLVHFHGEAYERYQETTPMLVPLPGRKAPETLHTLDRARKESQMEHEARV